MTSLSQRFMRLGSQPTRGLVGAMCPVCRTVQDWSGSHILNAKAFCRGTAETGPHPSQTVVVVSGKDPAC
jgi:hypothetical protein